MRKLFWLPPIYRADCFAVQDSTIALGHHSGGVSFIKFDLGAVPSGESSKSDFTMTHLTLLRVMFWARMFMNGFIFGVTGFVGFGRVGFF